MLLVKKFGPIVLPLFLASGCNLFQGKSNYEINSTRESRAPASSEAEGAKVEYQSWDQLAIDVEDGEPIVNPLSQIELGFDDLESAGPSIDVSSDSDSIPGTLQVTIPLDQSSGQASSLVGRQMIIIYRQPLEDGTFNLGFIPSSRITIQTDTIRFDTNFYGTFQAAWTKDTVLPTKENVVLDAESGVVDGKLGSEITWSAMAATTTSTGSRLFSGKFQGSADIDFCIAFVDKDKLRPYDFKTRVSSPSIEYAVDPNNEYQAFFICKGLDGLVSVPSPWTSGTKIESPDDSSESQPDADPRPATPIRPTLVSPTTSPGRLSTPELKVSGVASGYKVTVYKDANCSTTVVSGMAAGTSINLVTPTLGEGVHTFYAQVLNQKGTKSKCSEGRSYEYDETPPNAPTALSLQTPVTSPGKIATPIITVSGVSPGLKVELFQDAGCTIASGNGTATGTGINVTSTLLTEGSYLFYAQATDAAGNQSPCSSNSAAYELDLTPPSKPSTLALMTPASSPSQIDTPTISVDGLSAGLEVKLYKEATCENQIGSAVATGTSMNVTTSSLPDASYTIFAAAFDPAGNKSPCSTVSVAYEVDTGAPAKPSGIVLKTPSSSPSNDPTPEVTISGVASGLLVKLFTDAACTTLVSSGTATGTSIDLTASGQTDGTYNFFATATDPADNASDCSTETANYVLDTGIPSAPSNLSLNTPAVSPNNDSTPKITISGVTTGDQVGLFVDPTCSTQVGSGVAVASSINITSSALIDGSYSFYAKTTDLAGNPSPCSSATAGYILDTSPPAAPTAITLSTPASSPSNNSTPSLEITGVGTGDTIKIYSDAACSSQVTSVASTGSPVIVGIPALTEGVHDFYATSSDSLGNESACSTATVDYELDTIAPIAPNTLALNSPAASPGTDSTPQITIGGVESGFFVELHTEATCSSLTVSGNATGTTIDLTTAPLTEGSYIFYAKTKDLAGNPSGCSAISVAYTLDQSAPGAPSLDSTDPSLPSSNPSPSISGTTEADATVSIFDDSGCTTLVGSGTADALGNYSATITAIVGSHTYYAKATDVAGNLSVCSGGGITYDHYLIAPGLAVFNGTNTGAGGRLNMASPETMVWNGDFDYLKYDHDPGTDPDEIKVKAVGDYLVSLNIPITSDCTTLSRSHLQAKLLINDTPVAGATGSSGYIRCQSNHSESSIGFSFMADNLSVNDRLSIQVEEITTIAVSNITTSPTGAALTIQRVPDSNTIFYGTATQTTTSTNFNQGVAELEWVDQIRDPGFTYSGATPESIGFDAAGDYLVTITVPVTRSSGGDRTELNLRVLLNGSPVPGGVASHHIRGDKNLEGSLHWAGMVRASLANSTLSIDIASGAGGSDIATVPAGEFASLFIEKLASPSDTFFARASALTSAPDWNPGSPSTIAWDNIEMKDAVIFGHSTTGNNHQIVVNQSGDYSIFYNNSFITSGVQRANPKMVVKVNGAAVPGLEVKSNYLRGASGTFKGSGSLVGTLRGLHANDVITLEIQAEAGASVPIFTSVNLDQDTILVLRKK